MSCSDLKTAYQCLQITLRIITIHHYANFCYKRLSNWENIVQRNTHWTFVPYSDSDLEHSHAVFLLDASAYEIYHQKGLVAKGLAVKKIVSKHSCVVYTSSHFDLDFENSTPVFPHHTTTYDDVSPCQVSSQKARMFLRYRRDTHSWTFWTFPWVFIEHSNPIFSHDIMSCNDVMPHKSDSQKISRPGNIVETDILG